eukprot:1182110-Rhodomonas_salina.1
MSLTQPGLRRVRVPVYHVGEQNFEKGTFSASITMVITAGFKFNHSVAPSLDGLFFTSRLAPVCEFSSQATPAHSNFSVTESREVGRRPSKLGVSD